MDPRNFDLTRLSARARRNKKLVCGGTILLKLSNSKMLDTHKKSGKLGIGSDILEILMKNANDVSYMHKEKNVRGLYEKFDKKVYRIIGKSQSTVCRRRARDVLQHCYFIYPPTP